MPGRPTSLPSNCSRRDGSASSLAWSSRPKLRSSEKDSIERSNKQHATSNKESSSPVACCMLLVAFGARGGSVIRLGLIFGGRSAEHEVSVVSAEHVIAAVEHEEFEVVPIGVTKDGVWLSTQETRVALSRAEVAFKKRVVGTAGGVGRSIA